MSKWIHDGAFWWCLQGVGSRHLDPYSGAGRLGGALSHLEKTLKPDAAMLSATLPVALVQPQPEVSAAASPHPGPPTPGQLTPRQPRGLERCASQASASSTSCSGSSMVSSRDSSESSECGRMDACPADGPQQATRKRLHVHSYAAGDQPGGLHDHPRGATPPPSALSWTGAAPAAPTPEPLQHAWSAPGALPGSFQAVGAPLAHARFPAAAEPLGSPFQQPHRQGVLPPRALFQGPALASWLDHGVPPLAHSETRSTTAYAGSSSSGGSAFSRAALHTMEQIPSWPRDQPAGHAAPVQRCAYVAQPPVVPMRCESVPAPCSFAAGLALQQRTPEHWPLPSCAPAPQTPSRSYGPLGMCGQAEVRTYCGQAAKMEVPGLSSIQNRQPPALTGREAACLLDALLRLYHLGMVGAFRCASFQQQTATQAQQHVEELKHQLQVRLHSSPSLLCARGS